jgi:hypothetical protein
MNFDGLSHALLHFVNSFPGGDTAGKIRAIGGIIADNFFNYYLEFFQSFWFWWRRHLAGAFAQAGSLCHQLS